MVQITTIQSSTFVMPSPDELKKLDQIVVKRYPRFAVQVDESADARYRLFRHAFWGVGQLGRLANVETKNAHAASWWADHISQLLNQVGAYDHTDIGTGMLCVAVLAHGDVIHTITSSPHNLSFGLCLGTGVRTATDRWRTVLKTERLLPPATAPDLTPFYPEPKVTINTAGDEKAKQKDAVVGIGAMGGPRMEVPGF